MSIGNDDFLVELWTRLKPLIDKGDLQEAATHIVSVCNDHGLTDGLENSYDLDPELRLAIKDYLGDELDQDEDAEDGYEDYTDY